WSLLQVHPDRHLGWWWFGVGGRRGRLTVRLDFSSLDTGAVTARLDGADVAVQAHWVNADYVREPGQDLHLVVQRGLHKVLERARVQIRESDPAVLDRYAQFVYRTSAYLPPQAPATFANTFHAARLRQVGRLLARHVPPASRLLDVASGYS